MPSCPPVQVVEAAESASGLNLELVRPITSRRGASVYKLRDESAGRYALKLAYEEAEDSPYSPAAKLRHEAYFLRQLPDFSEHSFLAEGSFDEGYWVLKKWIQGTLVHNRALELRKIEEEKERQVSLASLFLKVIDTFSKIHDRGFLHGDVQPNHILLSQENEVSILDWSLSRRLDSNSPSYRGAFLHYAAPEVARGMREKSSSIVYGLAQEIFSVGATIFCLYSDWTVTGVSPQAPQPGAEAIYQRYLSQGPVELTETAAPSFPALEEFFRLSLATEPRDRAGDLIKASKALRHIL